MYMYIFMTSDSPVPYSSHTQIYDIQQHKYVQILYIFMCTHIHAHTYIHVYIPIYIRL